jgi:ABC-type glycerol-3-phosphate transport system substrate-binding protein
MRSAYADEMQEYVGLPLSQFSVRIFYNRDLYEELTGATEPPREYRAFLRACELIERRSAERGRPVTPVAASAYHIDMWDQRLFDPITYGLVRRADFNHDGMVGNDELFAAFRSGAVSFESPEVEARFKMIREVTRHFQHGFTGLTRDDAVFLFAQQRAVFISTGTWDVQSLADQAQDQFRVGVMDFPFPTADDPEYGRFVAGPVFDNSTTGFRFGVTRRSKHPEIAEDFLLFAASRDKNEQLNRIIGWIPAVRGTKVPPILGEFRPQTQGVYDAFKINLGGETWVKWLQLRSLYLVGQVSYERFAEQFGPFYRRHGYADLMEQNRDWRRARVRNEEFFAALRAEASRLPPGEAAAARTRYRTLVTQREIVQQIDQAVRMAAVEQESGKSGKQEGRK